MEHLAQAASLASEQDRHESNADEHVEFEPVLEHDDLSSTAIIGGHSFDDKPDDAAKQENPWHRDYRAKLIGLRSPTVRDRVYTFLKWIGMISSVGGLNPFSQIRQKL